MEVTTDTRLLEGVGFFLVLRIVSPLSMGGEGGDSRMGLISKNKSDLRMKKKCLKRPMNHLARNEMRLCAFFVMRPL